MLLKLSNNVDLVDASLSPFLGDFLNALNNVSGEWGTWVDLDARKPFNGKPELKND